jgi:hypothetical protein
VTVLMDERKSRRALEAVLWAVQQQIKLRPQVLHSLSLKWLSAAWSLAWLSLASYLSKISSAGVHGGAQGRKAAQGPGCGGGHPGTPFGVLASRADLPQRLPRRVL